MRCKQQVKAGRTHTDTPTESSESEVSKQMMWALTVQDHVFEPVNNSDVASLVDGGQVASAEPAIDEGLQACLGQLPVAFEDSGPSALHLAHFIGARLQGPALWAHQAHIQKAEGAARCAHQLQLLLGTATTSSLHGAPAGAAKCKQRCTHWHV